MKGSIKNEDGHYSVAIPFREDSYLPDNKVLAERRLDSLVKKFRSNPALKQGYVEAMEKLVEKGHAEQVPPLEGKPGATSYVPHHPVINKNKGKIRVVFDCAARYSGVSLNDQAMQGPDLTNGLFGTLLRFREFPVAVSADIEAMFHQVEVPSKDRDALRYLWWPNGDTEKEPEIFRMTRHLFGGTWSPSVCTYALQQTARNHSQDFKPEVAQAVLHGFYVDDYLKSLQTEAKAIEMVTDLPKLLARGGFRLCKWLCNKKEVPEAVPDSERVAGLQDLNLQALPIERTLGVLWDVNNDEFTYSMKPNIQPLTRRGLLSAVSAIYDPMRLITPFTIRGRKLIQDLVREKVSWDEPLSEQHLAGWQECLQELEFGPKIKVDRCLLPKEFWDISQAELHHISDASTAAFGAASYLRVVNTQGQIRCNLLFSRSRVAPLRQMTIPRLELAASTLAVQQDEMIRRELSIPINHSFFWTDSTIVLAYIRNETKRFHTYVANRLAVIHAGSTVGQWRHVSSEHNPADDITRGLSMQDLIHSTRWFHGSEFLSKPTIKEDAEPKVAVDLDGDPEVKHKAAMFSTAAKTDVIQNLIEHYSSWTRLKRAIARLLQIHAYLPSKAQKQEPSQPKMQLDIEDLQNAEKAIIRYVQSKQYAQEIQNLRSPAGKVKRTSNIYRLDPMLTAEGILVCGTRIGRNLCKDGTSRPVILPKHHPLSALLVKHYHEMSGHSGREYTITEIWSKYWIPGVRTTVRRLLHQCRTCRRLFAAPRAQWMADLPEVRLAKDEPPFANVGIDCFGPFTTKCGRKNHKRYGCIFTCLTTRAVHIEILDSVDTSSFVSALQRFISHRGHPSTISCDNGTNFIVEERELREVLSEWDQRTIDAFLSHWEIQWRFNPPAAFHIGGAWERLIRSTRRILSAVMTEQTITDDALNTLFCLVEGILNNRPLTTVPDSPADPEPVTSNHLLLIRPMPPPPPGIFRQTDCYVRQRWRQVQYIADVFWRRWLQEYLPLIQLCTKWRDKQET